MAGTIVVGHSGVTLEMAEEQDSPKPKSPKFLATFRTGQNNLQGGLYARDSTQDQQTTPTQIVVQFRN